MRAAHTHLRESFRQRRGQLRFVTGAFLLLLAPRRRGGVARGAASRASRRASARESDTHAGHERRRGRGLVRVAQQRPRRGLQHLLEAFVRSAHELRLSVVAGAQRGQLAQRRVLPLRGRHVRERRRGALARRPRREAARRGGADARDVAAAVASDVARARLGRASLARRQAARQRGRQRLSLQRAQQTCARVAWARFLRRSVAMCLGPSQAHAQAQHVCARARVQHTPCTASCWSSKGPQRRTIAAVFAPGEKRRRARVSRCESAHSPHQHSGLRQHARAARATSGVKRKVSQKMGVQFDRPPPQLTTSSQQSAGARR
jgi:hypothetical protein